MLRSKSLVLALLCHFLRVDAGFTYDFSNWIILPPNAKTIVGNIETLSALHVNRSEVVQDYLDHRQTNSYVMSVRGKGMQKNSIQPKGAGSDSDNLVVPLERAFAAVKNVCAVVRDFFNADDDDAVTKDVGRETSATGTSRKIKKVKKKKYKKFLLPLLLAYKLKFLTLIPVLIGGLILLVGTTGLAGFFFALFAAVMSLKSESKFELKQW